MSRRIATGVVVFATLFGSAAFADPADARMIKGRDRTVQHLRVTHVEPDNGKRLMWGLNNGAAFVTARPAACKREVRPRMCRMAYRKAIRQYGEWWR